MYSVYSKDRKSLQFPAYCDGYLSIIKDDAVAQENTGLWAHEGSILVEMMVTPYDVNGNPKQTVTNAKTMERRSSISASFFPYANRKDAKMCLMDCANLELKLNNTVPTAIENQPAEYAIEFSLTIGTTTTTITSDTVIKTSPVVRYSLSGNNKYLYDNHNAYAKKLLNPDGSAFTLSNVKVTSDKTFEIPGAAQQSFYEGQTLYSQSNEYLGTVQSISSPNITVTMSETWASTLTEVYEPVLQEPNYINVPHHIAVSYNHVNGLMSIIYNNELVKSGIHAEGGKWNIGNLDVQFGKHPISGSHSYEEIRESQFIGEMHEIAISSINQTSFSNMNTLVPFSRKLLFYLDFQEED